MILEIQHFNLGYGDIQVLWDIHLQIAEKEVVALAGSNGAGKSTLMKGIIGMLKPISGSIRLFGKEISPLPPSRRVPLGISLVPEGREIFYWMSVEENILMGAYTRAGRRRHSGIPGVGVQFISPAQGAPHPTGGDALRRGAADVRHRAGVDGRSEIASGG